MVEKLPKKKIIQQIPATLMTTTSELANWRMGSANNNWNIFISRNKRKINKAKETLKIQSSKEAEPLKSENLDWETIGVVIASAGIFNELGEQGCGGPCEISNNNSYYSQSR